MSYYDDILEACPYPLESTPGDGSFSQWNREVFRWCHREAAVEQAQREFDQIKPDFLKERGRALHALRNADPEGREYNFLKRDLERLDSGLLRTRQDRAQENLMAKIRLRTETELLLDDLAQTGTTVPISDTTVQS